MVLSRLGSLAGPMVADKFTILFAYLLLLFLFCFAATPAGGACFLPLSFDRRYDTGGGCRLTGTTTWLRIRWPPVSKALRPTWLGERQRERETERERDGDRERERERDREREGERKTMERWRQRETERDRERISWFKTKVWRHACRM